LSGKILEAGDFDWRCTADFNQLYRRINSANARIVFASGFVARLPIEIGVTPE
jgi:hypothetical protein